MNSADTLTVNTDTTSSKRDLIIDLAEVKQRIEQNRKALPEVTGDFNDFREFVTHLPTYDWYTITTMRDYLNVFLAKASDRNKDSTYFYFTNSYYNVINDESTALHERYPVTMEMLDAGQTTPETKRFKEFLNLFGADLFTTEGDFYIDAQTNYFLTVFDGRVSKSLNEYLVLRSKEMEEGFSEDAGLVINFEQVYERVIRWEKFIELHPDDVITGKAKYYLASYLSTLLSGMDNSPVFDYETEKLNFDVQKLYEKIIREAPSLKSTEIVKGYYDLLSKNEFRRSEELKKYIEAQELFSWQGFQPDLR